ncbi:unnamed protein product [Brassica oleracea var. botrytis]|uniref:(rape) hypothetical protein n=1 Tax=Brassica napus TaxID=3708 RepID=A0A816MFB1_BRANA|nr:unnamed protein product [Brassica napus]
MKLCLENNNPEAHYVEEINQFFFHDKSIKALNHLRHSTYGKYDEGYLCGLLLLCTGKIKEGKKIVDIFDWEHTIYIQPLLEKDKKKHSVFTVFL